MSGVSMRQMLEAGVHFGHQTRFWNPKMAPFIFGERNRIHIINLENSLPAVQRGRRLRQERGRRRRQGAVRGHQALGARSDRQGSGPLRHALRQPSLARRHAHQLQDDPSVDQAAARDRRDDRERRARPAQQARGADGAPRAREARPQPRRHQGHGRPAGRAVRRRRGSREDRHSRGPEARASRSSPWSTPTARRTASAT